MKVVVSSIATVKPSSATAKHLTHYSFSILDQLNEANFMPLIFYYPKPHHHNLQTILDNLKSSLSEALVSYYPIAGRINKDNLSIDCNDSGVHFSVAEVKCNISEVFEDPNAVDLNQLLPIHDMRNSGDQIFAVQVNVFECGSLAFGICFSHKVADLLSVLTFFELWATVNKTIFTGTVAHNSCCCRIFNTATLFPLREIKCSDTIKIKNTGGKIGTRRFVFSGDSISSLKAKYSDVKTTFHPTTSEALITFIWNRYSSIATDFTEKGIDPESWAIYQPVNLRAKTIPPLPDSSFGNIYRNAVVVVVEPPISAVEDGESFGMKMRNAVRKMDKDYVKRIQEGELEDVFVEQEATAKPTRLGFSSVFRFPFYEADFGWGKPVWVSSARYPFRNSIGFFPTNSGVGVEVWINMKEEDIAKLEVDKEFLAFASICSVNIIN